MSPRKRRDRLAEFEARLARAERERDTGIRIIRHQVILIARLERELDSTQRRETSTQGRETSRFVALYRTVIRNLKLLEVAVRHWRKRMMKRLANSFGEKGAA